MTDDQGVGSGNRHCLRCGFPEGGLLFCLITLAQRKLITLVFDSLSSPVTGPHCLMYLPVASLFNTLHLQPVWGEVTVAPSSLFTKKDILDLTC